MALFLHGKSKNNKLKNMKRYIALIVLITLPLGLLMSQPARIQPQPAVESSATHPVFYIEKDVVDLGTIQKNKAVDVEFTFTNNGKMPLVLKNVRTSCGCTEVSFPREPIMPGKTGTISVTYDASDSGTFNKKLTVLDNTKEGMHVLSIRGAIKE